LLLKEGKKGFDGQKKLKIKILIGSFWLDWSASLNHHFKNLDEK
jgi:hypothetical protein